MGLSRTLPRSKTVDNHTCNDQSNIKLNRSTSLLDKYKFDLRESKDESVVGKLYIIFL